MQRHVLNCMWTELKLCPQNKLRNLFRVAEQVSSIFSKNYKLPTKKINCMLKVIPELISVFKAWKTVFWQLVSLTLQSQLNFFVVLVVKLVYSWLKTVTQFACCFITNFYFLFLVCQLLQYTTEKGWTTSLSQKS